jgi:hypothetical protein
MGWSRRRRSPVHTDVDRHILDRALHPARSGGRSGVLERPLQTKDDVDVAPPWHHLHKCVELDPFALYGHEDVIMDPSAIRIANGAFF